jgi:DNA-binding CsgD family transcriptional regulator
MLSTDSEALADVRAALLAAVPVGVVLLDSHGNVVEVNPPAQHLLGVSEAPLVMVELAGRLWDPITRGPVRTADLPWRRALAGEVVRNRDLSVALPGLDDDTRIVTISARPFQVPGWTEDGAVVIAFDRVQMFSQPTQTVSLPPYLRRVLACLCQGRTTEEISAELNVTVATTRLYIKRLRMRFGVNNRSQLVLRAIELGMHPAAANPSLN